MTVKDFYFCYDKKVAKYLRYDKGIEFITVARHDKTGKRFWLFLQSEELSKALSEI